MLDDTPTATRRLLTLRQFPGLASTELGELAMIASNAVEHTFVPGAVVAAPPARLPALHLVLEGQIVSTGPAGTVASWGPRSVFGGLEVMAGRPVAAPAVAAKATRTLALSAADVVEVLEDNYNFLSSVRRALSGRLLELGIAHGQIDIGDRGRAQWPARVTHREIGMVDRLIMIRPQIPFALGKIQALAALAQAAEEVTWPAGAVVSRAGEHVDGAIVFVEGSLVASADGMPPRLLGPGHAIGRIETLAERPHTLTTGTLSPVRGLRCPGRVLFDVMEDHTDLALAMVATLAGQLLDVASRV